MQPKKCNFLLLNLESNDILSGHFINIFKFLIESKLSILVFCVLIVVTMINFSTFFHRLFREYMLVYLLKKYLHINVIIGTICTL